MPIQVQGPDGATIEFPDGTPQATMEAALQAHYGRAKPTAPQAPSPAALARKTYDDSSPLQRTIISAGAEVKSLGRGLGQLFTPNDSGVHKRLVAASDADAPFQDAPHGVTNVVGRTLPYLATLPLGGPETAVLSRVPQAGRLAQVAIKAGTAAAEGGAYGAAQETRTGQSRAQNVALGAGLGVTGRGAAGALRTQGERAAGAITDEARSLWETAKAHGITLTPAQLSDSAFVRTMSSALNKLPFSGGTGVQKRQQAGFNEAVSGSFGDKASKITDEVMASAKTKLGQAYDAIFGRNSVKLDDKAINRLSEIQHEASNLTPEHAAVVNKQIDDLLGMSKDGVIPGRAYQTFRVDRLKKLEQSAQNSEPFKAGLIRDIRQTVEDAANRSITGNDAAALKLTNQQYSNMKVAQKALKQVAGAGGDVKPASLWNIVNQRHGSTKEMRELARLGQGMKDAIPDSGTAQRQLAYHLLALGGGGYAATSDNPLIRDIGLLAAGGAVGGRAVNSKTLARLMMRDGRGQTQQALAPYVQRSPLLALLMAQQQSPDAGNGP